jgi:2-methylisocitrate lyase-like PEP mutase family enzyme
MGSRRPIRQKDMNPNPTPVDHDLADAAERLVDLHRTGDPVVLVNVWDAATAARVRAAGATAIATSSAAVNATLGQPDTNSADPDLVFAAIARISAGATVPVTADLEGGYGLAAPELVARLLAAGAVGCNLEDSDHDRPGELVAAAQFADRLGAVRVAASVAGVDVVINARVDTFLHAGDRDPEAVVVETIERARAYFDAGASCVYPIRLTDPALTRLLVDELPGPLNANVAPEGTVAELAAAGVSRVSLGARPFFVAIGAFDALAAEVLGGPA